MITCWYRGQDSQALQIEVIFRIEGGIHMMKRNIDVGRQVEYFSPQGGLVGHLSLTMGVD